MGKVYEGQTALSITATVGTDITGSTCLIKYLKPDGAEGEFDATIITAATGVIRYTVESENDIDQDGQWTFWGHVTFSDGTVAAGEPYKRYIYKEGK